MAPTIVSAWKKIRENEKSGLHSYRAQSEVIRASTFHLHGLNTAELPIRRRASSVETSTSSRYDDDCDVNQLGAGASLSTPSEMRLRIFVGSWNMAAKDPFVTAKSTGYIGDNLAAKKLEGLLPPGYDIYVLGTQEKVSKHLHAAVLARLHASTEPRGRRYAVLRERVWLRGRRRARSSNTPSQQSDDGDSVTEAEHRLRASSFALEASNSALRTPTHATATATNQTDEAAERISVKEVRGRGDGAFLKPKSTSIAIYCASDLEETVNIARSGTHKFSWSSGSKGGVAVVLNVADGRQSITFANCHLEANNPTLRRKQLAVLSTKLGEALGAVDLASSSDHVVWMGDFNYRIHTLDGETVLKLLVSGKHLDVHDRYDSMKGDLATVPTMTLFQEPRKWPTFYPTYKKIPGRPTRMNTQDPSWPTQTYRVLYKEPFYKGGKVKARVPGWCDRILYCSSDAHQNGEGSKLEVEQVRGDAETPRDNYRAVNDGLCESDHSPVFCTFQWTVPVAPPQTWSE